MPVLAQYFENEVETIQFKQKILRMKKTIGIWGGFVLSLFVVSANAQEPTQPPTNTPPSTWDAKKNPTVDSINAKYKDRMVPARTPMTIDQIFCFLSRQKELSGLKVFHKARLKLT